jgi:hypothetical protein
LVPAPALAQGTPWFVGGLGGVTFGTVTSGAVGAQFGVQVRPHLFVIGEAGRMHNVMQREIDDLLDSLREHEHDLRSHHVLSMSVCEPEISSNHQALKFGRPAAPAAS